MESGQLRPHREGKLMRARVAALLLAVPGTAAAEQPQAPAGGVGGRASITTADVDRRITTIAADSMRGRATPSRELDEVAAYVAGEFQRLKLRPGGDSGTYLQHYPLEVYRFEPDSSTLRATGRATASWRIGDDVLLVQGEAPTGKPSAPAVFVTGNPLRGGTLDSAAVAGKLAILSFGPQLNAIAGKLLPPRPLAILLVGDLPDSVWAPVPGRAARIRVRNPGEDVGLGVFATRIGTVGPSLRRAGVSLDSVPAWGQGGLQARPIADVQVQIDVWEGQLDDAAQAKIARLLQ